MSKLFPTSEVRDYYMYQGSLTTPPCTEAVNWYVSSKVLSASKSQLDSFRAHLSGDFTFAKGRGNNRALQPPNGRLVHYTEEESQDFSSWVLLTLALACAFLVVRTQLKSSGKSN